MTCARMSLKGTERGQVLNSSMGSRRRLHQHRRGGRSRHSPAYEDDPRRRPGEARCHGGAKRLFRRRRCHRRRRQSVVTETQIGWMRPIGVVQRPQSCPGQPTVEWDRKIHTGRSRTPRLQGNAGAWRTRRRQNSPRTAVYTQLLRPMGQSTSLARLGHLYRACHFRRIGRVGNRR